MQYINFYILLFVFWGVSLEKSFPSLRSQSYLLYLLSSFTFHFKLIFFWGPALCMTKRDIWTLLLFFHVDSQYSKYHQCNNYFSSVVGTLKKLNLKFLCKHRFVILFLDSEKVLDGALCIKIQPMKCQSQVGEQSHLSLTFPHLFII